MTDIDAEDIAQAIAEGVREKQIALIQTDILTSLVMRYGGRLVMDMSELADTPSGTITYDGTSTEGKFIITFLPDADIGDAH